MLHTLWVGIKVYLREGDWIFKPHILPGNQGRASLPAKHPGQISSPNIRSELPINAGVKIREVSTNSVCLDGFAGDH